MRDLAAVRDLQPRLNAADVNVLLLNIHEPVGSTLLERFDFRFTPTYLVFAPGGREVWRSHQLPVLDDVLAIAATE
jgi:hypothetical protein